MFCFVAFSLNRTLIRKRGKGIGSGESCYPAQGKKRAKTKKFHAQHQPQITLKNNCDENYGNSQRKRYDSTYYQRNKIAISTNRKNSYRKKREKPAEYPGIVKLNGFDENTVAENTVGDMVHTCGKCGALMFKDETHKPIAADSNDLCFSMCCSYGHIKVPPVSEPPAILRNLLSQKSKQSHHFLQNIHAYNSAFAFASMTLTGSE